MIADMLRMVAAVAACGLCLNFNSSDVAASGRPLAEGYGHSVATRTISLPTDRSLRVDSGLPMPGPMSPDGGFDRPEFVPPPASTADSTLPPDYFSLLMPRFDLSAEWEPAVDHVAVSSFDLSIQQAVPPVFGPPPPLLTAAYSITGIQAPVQLDLPESLQEFSLGLSWMRPISPSWTTRLMLSGAFASDLNNVGSDAWQLRGGLFALYRPNAEWNLAFGALATGRDDLPVIPAVGAIWQPSPNMKVNLMMPSPRVAVVLAETEHRQHWGYIGGAMTGGTWAYDRVSGQGDRLTYREWRCVFGWESIPPQPPGTFRPTGTRLNAEIGVSFGRRFEFDGNAPEITLGNAVLLRTGISF